MRKMTGQILFRIAALTTVSMSLAAQSSVDARLAEYREQIDGIDRQIVQLLNQRAAVVERIGHIKKEAKLPIAAPAREQQVLDHVLAAGREGPLPPATLRRIYQSILEEMRTWEAKRAALK